MLQITKSYMGATFNFSRKNVFMLSGVDGFMTLIEKNIVYMSVLKGSFLDIVLWVGHKVAWQGIEHGYNKGQPFCYRVRGMSRTSSYVRVRPHCKNK